MAIETVRQRLHEAVAAEAPFGEEETADGPDAGIVTGWILIAEWQGSDGNRWLSKLSADATGDRGLPSWTERGLCNEVVTNWPDSPEDEDG